MSQESPPRAPSPPVLATGNVRRRRRRFLAVVGAWLPRLLLAVTAALLAVALWRVLHGAGGLP